MTSTYERIYSVIKKIPKGRVATYGQIAELAGLAGQARQIGYALSALSDDHDIPWHRVVNAKGEISVRALPQYEKIQKEMLEWEGVEFSGAGRICLSDYQWASKNPGKPRHSLLLLLLLGLGILASASSSAFSDDRPGYDNHLELTIKMDKTIYQVKDPIDGKVIIRNTAPATIPGSFVVELYHDKTLSFTTTITIKTLFTGDTDFAFKNFGIPQINDKPEDAGWWRLVIYPANRDEKSGVQKEFQIKE